MTLTLLVLLSACAKQTSLADTMWKLTSLTGKTFLKDVDVTLNFSTDAIGGNDGCNSYGGSYKTDQNNIKFNNDVFSTMMYCSDEIDVQSRAFYQALTDSATYKVAGSTLSLIDKNGIVLAEFAANQD